MGPQIVFAVYRPRKGKDKVLEKLIARHVPTLRKLGLATARKPVVARSRNGTYIEVFEWESEEAVKQAHEHPKVAQIWETMGRVCEFSKLESLPETKEEFPHFKPVRL